MFEEFSSLDRRIRGARTSYNKLYGEAGTGHLEASVDSYRLMTESAGKLRNILREIKNVFQQVAAQQNAVSQKIAFSESKYEKIRRILMEEVQLNKQKLSIIESQLRSQKQQHDLLKKHMQSEQRLLQDDQKKFSAREERIKRLYEQLRNLGSALPDMHRMLDVFNESSIKIGDSVKQLAMIKAQEDAINKTMAAISSANLKQGPLYDRIQNRIKSIVSMQKELSKLGMSILDTSKMRAEYAKEIAEFEKDAALAVQMAAKAELEEKRGNAIKQMKDSFLGEYTRKFESLSTIVHNLKSIPGLFAKALPIALISGLLLLLKRLIDSGRATTRELLNAGVSARQFETSFGQLSGDNAVAMNRGLKISVFEGMERSATARAALITNMNAINISSDLVANVRELSEAYGMSVDNAAKLVTFLDTLSKKNDKFGNSIIDFLKRTAISYDVTIGQLSQDLVDNADLLARAGQRGTREFIKMAAALRSSRIEMGAINSFADTIVSDFGGWLERQANLQAMIPGLNLDKVAYASFFGDLTQVTDELRSALQASGVRDLGQSGMTRALQVMLQKNTQLPFEQIQAILSDIGKDATESEINRLDISQETANTTIHRAFSENGLIITILQRMLQSIDAIKGAINLMTGFIPSIGQALFLNTPENAKVKARAGEGIARGFSLTPKFHSGGIVDTLKKKLLPNEIPAILQKGEVVLTNTHLKGLTSIVDSVRNLSGISTKIGATLSKIKLPSLDKIMGGSISGISSKIEGLFGSGATGGLLGKIGGLFGGGSGGGILGKIGGLFKGSTGGLLGKIGGLFGGGSGGIGGMLQKGIGGLLGGGGGGIGGLLGGGLSKMFGGALAGGPIGMLGSLAMPLLGKLPGIGSVLGGAQKVIGGVFKSIGGLFGVNKDKKRLEQNSKMFSMAQAGDMSAVDFLQKEATSGKSEKSRKDAFEKYQQLVQMSQMSQMSQMGAMVGGYGMPMQAPAAPAVSTENMEMLLTQILQALKTGSTINMDSMKVGQSILRAYNGV